MDFLSRDPKVLAAVADEAIARLKEELAKFDATQLPHYERLVAYAQEARDDEDVDRYEDFSREADRYRARWHDARQPFIQEIYRISMAKDAVTPQSLTFAKAAAIGADLSLPA